MEYWLQEKYLHMPVVLLLGAIVCVSLGAFWPLWSHPVLQAHLFLLRVNYIMHIYQLDYFPYAYLLLVCDPSQSCYLCLLFGHCPGRELCHPKSTSR